MKLPALLICAIAGIYILGDAVLAPAPERPDLVDAMLASRAALAAMRLAVVFGGVYVVVSVIALIAQGRWLIRVGPVEVSEQVADATSQNARLEGELAEMREASASLRQELSALKKRRASRERSGSNGERRNARSGRKDR